MEWTKVQEAVEKSVAIAWDGCHKIYILADLDQAQRFHELGYGEGESEIHGTEDLGDEAFPMVSDWWEQSCFLRFISLVSTDQGGGTDWTDLVEQFEDEAEVS